jgi:hypothetical protein
MTRTFELAGVPNMLFGVPIKYLLFACIALSVLTVLTFPRTATNVREKEQKIVL